MRYRINLTTRTYLDHHLVNRVAYSSIALLVVVLVWNISRVVTLSNENGRLETEISAIQRKNNAKSPAVTETETNLQKKQIRFFNEIISRKSFSWLNQLDVFENVTPVGISLSSLAPGKNRLEWKIEGHAKSFKAVRQYLEQLEASDRFSNVLLLSHQEMAADDKVRGVKFSISCTVVER